MEFIQYVWIIKSMKTPLMGHAARMGAEEKFINNSYSENMSKRYHLWRCRSR
jgi:hypothetical protein